MKGNHRIPVDGGQSLNQNPFAKLESLGLPPGPETSSASASGSDAGPASSTSQRHQPNKNRGRLEIRRQTAHRGGKTVTVVSGFVGIGLPEKEQLAKAMQRACGTGGTVKDGNIEIQGDKRPEVVKILTDAGFRPVLAGG